MEELSDMDEDEEIEANESKFSSAEKMGTMIEDLSTRSGSDQTKIDQSISKIDISNEFLE